MLPVQPTLATIKTICQESTVWERLLPVPSVEHKEALEHRREVSRLT